MKKTLAAWLLTFATLFTHGQTTNFSLLNKPISDPEIPNYGRGAQFWNGVLWDNSQAPQVPPGNPTAKTGYRRFWWYEMEAAQGVYTFTGGYPSIEWHLKDLADKGMQLSYGSVMTAYDGGGTFYDGANSVYPQYLHDLMQAEPGTPDWVYNGTNSWIPNWNSPSYLARWRVLQDTIYKFIQNWTYTPSTGPWAGKLVRGKHMLVDADVRGYGNFGEWHTYPWTESTPANAVATDSSIVKIIDATKDAFKDVPLHINVAIFDANPWGDHNPFRAWYALTRTNDWGPFGYRDDGIGDPGKWWLYDNPWTYGGYLIDTALDNRWKYSLNTGEPLNGSGTCCPYYYDVRSQVTTKSHYAIFGNGNYGSTTQAVWDTMNNAFKLAGYRFNLNGGSMTTNLTPDGQFQVTLKWRNIGNAPLYQKRWKVKYQLRNSADAEVQTWTSGFSPFMYLPDTKDSIVSDTFKLSALVPTGSGYKLVMYLQDTTGLCEPLYLPLTFPGRGADGTYTLRTGISVTGSLPSYFQNYYAYNKTNRVEIAWKTTCDPSASYYIVQESLNGVLFTNIDTVYANEFSCVSKSYKVDDYAYVPGRSYYRVAKYNINGAVTYTGIMTVVMPTNNAVIIYPKPTTGVINLILTSIYRGSVKVNISTVTGQVVRTYNFTKAGSTLSVALNITGFSVGTYIISTYQGGVLYNSQSQVKN